VRPGDGGAHPPTWRIEAERRVSLRDGQVALLRPLHAADAERLAAFFADFTPRETYYFFGLNEHEARNLALHAAEDSAYRLIALDERQERLLGYTFLQWRQTGVPSFGVCLHRDAQSHGLGWPLIDHLFTSAASSGVGVVTLTVHPDNGPALRLYQRAGFRLVDEFVNHHQGVKQYRMEADLRRDRPPLLEGLAIVPGGGMGVGLAAAAVQDAVERQTGRLPLLLGMPPSGWAAIFVADLALPPAHPVPLATPVPGPRETANGWITRLDRRHLLIGGVGVPALTAACRRFSLSLRNQGRAKAWLDAL
jgi:RimJ/RimL family protein N-acetyltransferase